MKSVLTIPAALAALALLSGCGAGADDERNAAATAERPQRDAAGAATAFAYRAETVSRDELERDRMNMDWRQYVSRDDTTGRAASAGTGGPSPDRATAAGRGDTAASSGAGAMDTDTAAGSSDESWDDISAESVNSSPTVLPLHGDVAGPSVLRVQILLDRALFSPGIIDGRWGRNTEKAVHWFQEREGLDATGRVDERTWQRLQQLASAPDSLARRHRLTADDVEGPFVDLPDDYYDRRDMDCQCYESLAEKLAERFHTSEELLQQLNPDADLNAVTAGDVLHVPASRDVAGSTDVAGSSDVARIVISDGGRYLQALDASGRVLYHFPATLGSAYSPSPTGEYRITAIAHDPTWHYQPSILEGVDDDEPDAVLPPGPNNAVGVVWMQLSEPHYGIHGTSAPETIGYATSNGCVRLTNWDARFLAERIREGVTVEFRDVTG